MPRQPDETPAAPPSPLEDVWCEHAAAIRRTCVAMIGIDAGEEAFARAALVAVRAYPRDAHKVRDVRSWLLRLARNVCIDLVRRGRQEHWRQDVDVDAVAPLSIACTPRTPEQILLRHELVRRLQRFLDELPPLYRQTMRLHLDDRAPREIADRLGVTEVTVRKRLQMARDLLRLRLHGDRTRELRASLARRRGPATPAPAGVWTSVVTLLAGGTPRECILFSDRPPRPASLRRIERAREHMEKHGRGWKAILEHARSLRDAARVDDALAEYDRILLRRPDAADAVAERTALLLGCGDRERAVHGCERALFAARGAQRARIDLWLAIANGNAAAITAGAESPGVMLVDRAAAAAELLRLGEPCVAARLLEPLLAAHPGDATLLALSHHALLAAGDEAGARLRFEEASAADPRHPLLRQRED